MKKIKVPAEKAEAVIAAINSGMCARGVFANISTKPHKKPGYIWVIIG